MNSNYRSPYGDLPRVGDTVTIRGRHYVIVHVSATNAIVRDDEGYERRVPMVAIQPNN